VDEKTKLKHEFYRRVPIIKAEQRDAVWALLESEGYVDVALTEAPESPLQVLLKDADLIIKGAEMGSRFAMPPPPSTGEQEEQEGQNEIEEIHPVLDDLERERAAAFEEHIARIAANDFRVRRFRERVLGGELLTPEKALTLIRSPAAWGFSRLQFEHWGIPLTDHTAELEELEEYRADGRVGNRFTVRVEPPGIERTISRLLRKLPFVDESGYAENFTVGEGSVLGELADIADKLHATYPWESKADIVHFVLTGAIPAVPPVRMYYSRKGKLGGELSPGSFSHGTITLEVAPWISAKSVEAAFRDAKRQVSRNRKYRRLEEKSLKMIRFVAQYDEPPKGRRLLEAWNAQELVKERIENDPTWYYNPDKRGESSRFWRDYHRARHALVYEKRPKPDDG
jgi:hypothetical protein